MFGGVFDTEALEQSPDDVALDDPGDNLRVEALGLRAVSQYEDFFLRVAINGRLTLAAHQGEGAGTQKQVDEVSVAACPETWLFCAKCGDFFERK